MTRYRLAHILIAEQARYQQVGDGILCVARYPGAVDTQHGQASPAYSLRRVVFSAVTRNVRTLRVERGDGTKPVGSPK